MRIAILTNDDPAHPKGGAARIADAQRAALASAHDVRVFAHTPAWTTRPALARLFHHLGDLGAQASVVSDVSAFHPDVLITQNVTGCGFATPRAIRDATRCKWIHVLHDVQLFEPGGQMRSDRITLWQRAWSFLRRSAFGTPDLVLSPTCWLLEEHRRRGFFPSTRMEVLPNPAPPNQTRPHREPHVPLRLLFVGRVSKEKGSGMLARLSSNELWVVGEGDMDARAPVKRLGALDHAGVLKAMQEADVLLVPSQIAENQPTVILEAASVGLPVIASAIGGIPETLEGAGTVVSPSDVQEWVDAIAALSDPQAYEHAVAKMDVLRKRHDPHAYASRLHLLISNA